MTQVATLILLLYVSSISAKNYKIILNRRSDCVLDGSTNPPKIELPNNGSAQIWSLEHVGFGKVYIINAANKKVLTLDGVRSDKERFQQGNLSLTPKGSQYSQQWYINSDRTISDAKYGLVIDVEFENTAPGSDVVGYTRLRLEDSALNNIDNQKTELILI